MAWDSTMIKEGKTIAQRARIVLSRLKAGDTADGVKYSLGGLYVRGMISYVSTKALKNIPLSERSKLIVPKEGVMYDKVKPRAWVVTREHMIPISALYKHLKWIYENRFNKNKERAEKYIIRFMKKLHIALITTAESKKLKKAGLEKCMPNGWWESTALDPLARYREAGFKDTMWVKDFLNKDMLPNRKTNSKQQKKGKTK